MASASRKRNTSVNKNKANGSGASVSRSEHSDTARDGISKNTKSQPPGYQKAIGLILLILALFTFASYRRVKAMFSDFLAVLLKGCFGWGYYLAAPSLALAALILLTERERPVKLRTGCALLMPLLGGVIGHVSFCREQYSSGVLILAELWKSGSQVCSGGAVSGLLAELSEMIFSAPVSRIAYSILFVVALLTALNTAQSAFQTLQELWKTVPAAMQNTMQKLQNRSRDNDKYDRERSGHNEYHYGIGISAPTSSRFSFWREPVSPPERASQEIPPKSSPVLRSQRSRHTRPQRFAQQKDSKPESAALPWQNGQLYNLSPHAVQQRRREQPFNFTAINAQRSQIDIPLDDDERPKSYRDRVTPRRNSRFTSFFRHKSEDMRTPDQVVSEPPADSADAACQPAAAAPREPGRGRTFKPVVRPSNTVPLRPVHVVPDDPEDDEFFADEAQNVSDSSFDGRNFDAESGDYPQNYSDDYPGEYAGYSEGDFAGETYDGANDTNGGYFDELEELDDSDEVDPEEFQSEESDDFRRRTGKLKLEKTKSGQNKAEKSPARPKSKNTRRTPDSKNNKNTHNTHTQNTSGVTEEPSVTDASDKEYIHPPLSLLYKNKLENHMEIGEELNINSERLADTLDSFGVKGVPGEPVHGPTVTRYEFTLSRGVKLSKITNLADDIALSLGATGVRIAPIPDKLSVVGIEVPNKQVTPVLIRDVIESSVFQDEPSKAIFALGRDISGNNVVGDISSLPHVLIAGTTGSGKSVCTNSLIVSLLYKATPDEVRFIMIDPKMVELAPYNGIPHLLIPVVTDPKKAAGALQWAVYEMMRRYKMFSECGVKKIEEYNKLAQKKNAAACLEALKRPEISGYASPDDETDKAWEALPRIVVVIDELADLMLIAAEEVEESICRVAQMGRAAGIHLVIATQRPSADVITGLMKANIPSRIAFAVASSLESRIILDSVGAEKLVGRGDMLYSPLGGGKPIRVQGCYITPEEIQSVVEFVKERGEVQYSDEVIARIEASMQESDSDGGRTPKKSGRGSVNANPNEKMRNYTLIPEDDMEEDELFPVAVDIVLQTGQGLVSTLQQRLKLGYKRAAHLMKQMEELGIVGPFEGSNPRQLLITSEQWQSMKESGNLNAHEWKDNSSEVQAENSIS